MRRRLGQGREALFLAQGAGLADGDRRGVEPVGGVLEPLAAPALKSAHPPERRVLEQARVQGAERRSGGVA